MKTINKIYKNTITLLVLVFILTLSCERELPEDVNFAQFPNTPEIFTDTPVGMGSDFYFPYLGSKATAWSVDTEESYMGSASMRFDVPNANDPEGNYAGAIFRVDGAGRNLSDYDALTFWAKASQGVTIAQFGFGEDFMENEYVVTLESVSLGTAWQKVIIPIPDASKLLDERGMFRYAAGTAGTGGAAYTFWVDELKFENLGTIGQPRPEILGGTNQIAQGNVGVTLPLTGLAETFNLPNGQDVTIDVAPSYFEFTTSNPFVASVSELGIVSIDGFGTTDNTATITGSIAGVEASGSLLVEATNIEVISIFSDLYANIPVDNYNGFYEPFQTTLGGAIVENGNNIIDYTLFNFVAIEFYGRDGSGNQPIDITDMTHLHIEIRPNEIIQASDYINISLFNNFTQAGEVSGEVAISGSDLVSNEWVAFDIPLSSFNGLTARDAVGMMLFVSDNTIANVSLDNIYFYAE